MFNKKNIFLLITTLFILSVLINSCSEPEPELKTYMQWHTITLSFTGPSTGENAKENPFLNYRLNVEFHHQDSKQIIRGFYAADGNSAESSAADGNIWQVRFTPNKIGKWTYKATLQKGDSIALQKNLAIGEEISIKNDEDSFMVVVSDKTGNDFRAKGRLEASKGFFKFRNSNEYWLKTGTNSPENLLAYTDFDNTFRMLSEAREGEATAPDSIHSFLPHMQDWHTGDPTWKKEKGKSLIGAINYLASKGMNSAYFLTMNILGDGKDVWPYASPDDFTRFDVSKLDQWEIVFKHMQSKGILLHMVLQETENETLLDNGETGPLRQLYLQELIARFGHHLALVWNLGEENGPAEWSPIGQNDRQRKSMSEFLKKNDPYKHPVLLHTHSVDPLRSDILNEIIGFEFVDGLSLQQSERKQTATVVNEWRMKSQEKKHDWLITMDEIGKWHTGALSDAQDPNHDTLRQYVLWGSLLSGGAGVEWYFGAKHPQNDLTSEDWRQRDRLWEITNHAKEFFNSHLPYWKMQPKHSLVSSKEAYCLRKVNEIYAVYLPNSDTYTLDLTEAEGTFSLKWFNPLEGGALKVSTTTKVIGGDIRSLGSPPNDFDYPQNQDWVCLLERL